jgi:hypothetical protein
VVLVLLKESGEIDLVAGARGEDVGGVKLDAWSLQAYGFLFI